MNQQLNKRIDRKEKCWLVKSNGKILGPLSFDEMVDKVLSREIVVLDECINHLGRWRYVRDEPMFVQAINELRSHPPLGEETKTETLAGGTQTITETSDIEVEFNSAKGSSGVSNVVDADFQEYGEDRSNNYSDEPVKQYGYGSDQSIRQDAQKSSSKLYIVMAILLLAAGYWAYQFKTQKQDGKDVTSFEYLNDEGARSYRYGEYDKAFNLLSQGAEKRQTDVDLKLLLAPLYIRNSEMVQARRLLQEVLAVRYQDDYSKVANTALGLTYLVDQDLGTAKSYFSKSLKVDKNYIPANFNMGMISFLNGRFSEAKDFFTKAKDYGSAESHLMLAKVYISEADRKAGQRASFLQKAADELDKLIDQSYNYRREAFLLASFVASKQNRDIGLKSFVDRFLETDPELSRDHVNSLLLYRNEIAWSSLLDSCTRLFRSSGKGSRFRSFYASCLFYTGKKMDAKNNFENATTGTKDGLVHANYSYFLQAFKEPNRAKAALTQAFKTSPNLALVKLLKGRECESEKDFACAKKFYGDVSSLPAYVLPGKVGLSRIAFEEGNKKRASELVNDVRNISSNYAPALRISDRLASE